MFTKKRTNLLKQAFIAIALALMVVVSGLAAPTGEARAETTVKPSPGITVVGVEKGSKATVQAVGFPANITFEILMGKIGTRGEDGTYVGRATTDKNGEFNATVAIPSELRRDSRIAIRIQALGSSGWYAYNWFDNVTKGTTGNTGSSGGSGGPTSGGSPVGTAKRAVNIVDVEEDLFVEISARGLSASQTYSVWYQWMSSRGTTGSVRAGSVTSNKDGSVSATIDMPRSVRDRTTLAIRLTASGEAYTSDWFANASTDDSAGGGAPYGATSKAPLIYIASVEKGDSVTVIGRNFPTRKSFDVLIGKMGTEGIKGIEVDTVKIEKDGSFKATFDIPRDLRERSQLSIRLEASDGSGYYAYTWFNNK